MWLQCEHSYAGQTRHPASLQRDHQARDDETTPRGRPAAPQEPGAARGPHRGVFCPLPRQHPHSVHRDYPKTPPTVVGRRRRLKPAAHTHTEIQPETLLHQTLCLSGPPCGAFKHTAFNRMDGGGRVPKRRTAVTGCVYLFVFVFRLKHTHTHKHPNSGLVLSTSAAHTRLRPELFLNSFLRIYHWFYMLSSSLICVFL